MNWKGWLALILIALALLAGSTGRADESKYIPRCIEDHPCKEEKHKNTLYFFSGPTNMQVSGEPNETSMSIVYMRRVTNELSLGTGVLGTNKRFLGVQLGFGYSF